MTGEQEVQLVGLAIEAIGKVIEAVRGAKSGAIDPAKAIADISALHDVLTSNNVAIDALEAAKFGGA